MGNMNGIQRWSPLWVLTLIAVAIFPFAGVAVRAIGKRLYKINKRAQQKMAELNVVLQESFTGTKIVKAFGREALEQQRFNDVNDRLMRLAVPTAPASDNEEGSFGRRATGPETREHGPRDARKSRVERTGTRVAIGGLIGRPVVGRTR